MKDPILVTTFLYDGSILRINENDFMLNPATTTFDDFDEAITEIINILTGGSMNSFYKLYDKERKIGRALLNGRCEIKIDATKEGI